MNREYEKIYFDAVQRVYRATMALGDKQILEIGVDDKIIKEYEDAVAFYNDIHSKYFGDSLKENY